MSDEPKEGNCKTPPRWRWYPPERIVTLRSGGTVRVLLDYNPFKLTAEDRDFVFGLIGMIQNYEAGTHDGDCAP